MPSMHAAEPRPLIGFATLIRKRRAELGLPAWRVALACGLGPTTIAGIERRPPLRLPGRDVLDRLAAVLQIDRDALVAAALDDGPAATPLEAAALA